MLVRKASPVPVTNSAAAHKPPLHRSGQGTSPRPLRVADSEPRGKVRPYRCAIFMTRDGRRNPARCRAARGEFDNLPQHEDKDNERSTAL
jgi:hypothetical protein